VDGDTDEDLGGGITNDGDGNVFATGTLFRDGIDEDIWVGSWAADGTERFVLLYDVSQGGYERGRDISLGPNDSLLVVADGQSGGRIVRLGNDGMFQSDAALLGEAGASYSPTAITVSPSGFYSVGMDFVSPNTLPAALRLSNFVQVLWSRDDAQGPAASARYTSVAADALDDAYACGISGAQGFIHKRLSASGDLDQIVDALPPLSGIGVAGNGDLVVAGPRFVNGQGDNLWVSRRGPDGADAVWEFDVDGGDNLDDRVAGVALDPNDRIVVAGSAVGDAAADAIVIKLDGDGALLWSTRGSAAEGSGVYNEVNDVAVDANGDVSIVGTFFGDAGDGEIFVAHFAR
jgi:hypothetical protein